MTSTRSQPDANASVPSDVRAAVADASYDDGPLTEGLFELDDLLDDESIRDDDPLSDRRP